MATPRAQSAAFEVVSIKPARFESDSYFAGYSAGAGLCGFSRFTPVGPRVSIPAATACSLIRMAYDIKDYQVVAMPARMEGKEQSAWYEVDARAASGTTLTVEHARLMLQTMLADRFKLKLHREPRGTPVYALVVSSQGHRLSTTDIVCPKPRMTMIAGPGLLTSCKPQMSMSQLAIALSRELDRPVVDRTALTGMYALSLEWASNDPLALVIDYIEPPSPN